VVGMGTGALAAYPQPRRLTFHEIDPEVVAIASDPRYFSYLADSTAKWDVALGDGRLTVAAVPDGEYGLIVLDAFSSDAIPIHLLTREAIETYLKKLRPGGLLAFHISNHFVDLEPVLARQAKDLGLTALVRTDDIDEATAREKGRFACVWAVLARDAADLAPLGKDARWLPAQTKPGVEPWTDDFSNIWTVFQWN